MSTIVIHGHFYQPPRENPWTGVLDREDSAHPYHDWNERIHAECYRANAFARIVDQRGRIERIVNNYRNISFNFGPTLLTWLAHHAPDTYARILEADRESMRARRGHGNAIAQGYNHAILPLCTPRDRRTQVAWGIADFRYRFNRMPEALWLPETACNEATLDTLIEARMKFVILSPYQAEAVRPTEDAKWTTVADGGADPRIPYAYFHSDGSGRSIAVFFYDAAVSRAIAFEGALVSSDALLDRLALALGDSDGFANVATDGESYGHHSRFGDRCLAYALEMLASERRLAVTNYGDFLAGHPPRTEVRLKPGADGEGTAWSCAHGLGRWLRDCGCSTGGRDGWNQTWRTPLRAALDRLRDEAARCFEDVGEALLRDPWAARDDYIRVILDRDRELDGFLDRHARRRLGESEQVRALTLLEMQRAAMLMYTSCGWFFADISGIETVQVLKYAGRVMDFMEKLDLAPPTNRFLETLAEARSNIPAMGNGADVYRKLAEPSRTTSRRLAAHLSLSSLGGYGGKEGQIGAYLFRRDEYRKEQRGRLTLATSRLQIIDRMTGEHHDYMVAALHLGALDFYGVLKQFPGGYRFGQAAENLWGQFPVASLPTLLRLIQSEFGPDEYELGDVLPDGRRAICELVFGDLLDEFSSRVFDLYSDNRRLVDMLEEAGFEMPPELREVAEFALARTFGDALREYARRRDREAFQKTVEVADEAGRHGFRLGRSLAEFKPARLIGDVVRQAIAEPEAGNLEAAVGLVTMTQKLSEGAELDQAQEIVYDALRKGGERAARFARLAAALGLAPTIWRTDAKAGELPHDRSAAASG